MELPKIIENLYTNTKSNWILSIDSLHIQPYLIQYWLSMNDNLRVQVRWLDKYVFVLPPKMYLSLAWSIIPKVVKVPFTKFIKRGEDDNEYDFILKEVRKHLELSDNDFSKNKTRIINNIKNDMPNWFMFYGIDKQHWKKYNLDYKLVEKGLKNKKKEVSLTNWGL